MYRWPSSKDKQKVFIQYVVMQQAINMMAGNEQNEWMNEWNIENETKTFAETDRLTIINKDMKDIPYR